MYRKVYAIINPMEESIKDHLTKHKNCVFKTFSGPSYFGTLTIFFQNKANIPYNFNLKRSDKAEHYFKNS